MTAQLVSSSYIKSTVANEQPSVSRSESSGASNSTAQLVSTGASTTTAQLVSSSSIKSTGPTRAAPPVSCCCH